MVAQPPLSARRLVIDEKCRPYPVAVAAPGHFRHHDGGPVDARIVLRSPGISLYCLDPVRREALFVEAPADVDLGAAPFYYQAQYAAATGLIAVGFDTLHRLADEAPDVDRPILLYSVGRCGSTVVGRMLREAPGVTAFSEPDVFTQLISAREAGDLSADDVSALVRSATRILCAHHRDTVPAIKFRSFAVGLAAEFARHFPAARPVFLYRDAQTWAASTMRAFGPPAPEPESAQAAAQDRLGRLLPLLARYRAERGRLLTRVEAMACHWVAVMHAARSWPDAGPVPFGLRYDDLVAEPRAALTALAAYAGVALPPDDVVDAVLATDSQAGSTLERVALDQTPRPLFDADELVRVIGDLASRWPGTPLRADTVLAGTWRPAARTPV